MEIPVLTNGTTTELAPELLGKRVTIKYDNSANGTSPVTAAGWLTAYVHENDAVMVFFEHGVKLYITSPLEITVHVDKIGR